MTALAKLLKTSTFRWLAAYLAVFVAVSAGVVGYIFWHTNDLLTRQVVQTLAAEVGGLRDQYRAGGLPLLNRTIAERSRNPGSSLYLLTSTDGQVMSGNITRIPEGIADPATGGLFRYARDGAGGTQTRLAAGVTIDVADGYVLLVGRDVEDQRRFAETTRRILLWGLGIIAFAGLGGGVLASRRILQRVDAVTAASRTIMAGNLAGRIPVTGSGDELDRLSVSLNVMLERIEQLMTGMREVSDNIAHDLKTPLNRMRNRIEAALREPAGETGYRDTLECTLEESDDLIKTFAAMLSIARLEAGAVGDNMAPTDIGALVSDSAELYEPVAEEAGVRLTATIADGLVVHGDRQLIGQAIANLIDNALKYGRAGGSAAGSPAIQLAAAREGGVAIISVGDHGAGIPAEERERVFKRFVRLEVSRSRPGSGLGLSLVAAVARLHGGTVRLEDNKPGLRAIIALPLAGPHNG